MVTSTKLTGKVGIGDHAAVAAPPTNGSAHRVAGRNAPSPPPTKKKGGRKREDGLASGSPAAIEADKQKDRFRKQQERALADPAPLPSADSPAGDKTTAAPSVEGPRSGDSAGLQPVPWEAKDFAGRINTLFDGAEKVRMAKREFISRKAGFSEQAVTKHVNDARFPGAAKAEICEDMGEGAAWMANKLKMSKGAVKGGFGLVAAIFFIRSIRQSDADFHKAVAEMQKRGGKPEEAKV